MNAIRLGNIAYARSGDKGAGANIGVVANDPAAYEFLINSLTADAVAKYFASLKPSKVIRYELPNLHALNFVLLDVLDGGGSMSLQLDAQGKTLGQLILEMTLEGDANG